MEEEALELISQSVKKLRRAAQHYAASQPDLAAVYMYEASNMMTKMKMPVRHQRSVCQFCGAVFRPGTCRVSVAPRMKTNNKIKKLLQHAATRPVGKFKQNLLKLYTAENRLIWLCLKCGKKTTFPGAGRITATNRKKHQQLSEASKVKVTLSKRGKKRQKQKKKYGRDTSESILDQALKLASSRKHKHTRTNDCSTSASGEVVDNVNSTPISAILVSKAQVPAALKSTKVEEVSRNGVSQGCGDDSTKQKKSSLESDVHLTAGVTVTSRKGKRSKKDLHNKLHRMLTLQKQSNSAGSLKQFLSSL